MQHFHSSDLIWRIEFALQVCMHI